MLRAVNRSIDAARLAVVLADILPTARALRHFVRSDDLVGTALARSHAFSTEAPLSMWRRGRRRCRMLLADGTAADRARSHALAARRMVAFRARQLVLRAVRLVTGNARSGVLRAGSAAVNVARGDAVVPTEDAVTSIACGSACVARDMSRIA